MCEKLENDTLCEIDGVYLISFLVYVKILLKKY